jgi:hypothetical protein
MDSTSGGLVCVALGSSFTVVVPTRAFRYRMIGVCVCASGINAGNVCTPAFCACGEYYAAYVLSFGR